MRSVLIFLALVSFCTANGYSQRWFEYDAAAEAQFAEGVKLYELNEFSKAAQRFDILRQSSKPHQRLTAAYIMAAKARFELKDYNSVLLLLTEYLQKFPNSSYQADAYYTLSLTSFVQHHYDDAARKLLRGMETGKDSVIMTKSAELFEIVADRHLSVDVLRTLYASIHTPTVRDLVKLKLAEKLFAGGEPSRARTILEDTVTQGYFSAYTARISAMRKKIGAATGYKIGALLPLMKSLDKNAVKTLAGEVLEGITYALDEYKERMGASATSITLDVRDTERDSALAVQETRNLARSLETIAVIGPLFSNTAMLCAPIANAARLPMISPTATSNGIADVGPYIFQANPDFVARGKAVAQFASRQLGISRVAVLSPKEGVGKYVADSFLAEAVQAGLDVLAYETYSPADENFREQFMNIRRSVLKKVPTISFAKRYSETEISGMISAGASATLIDSLRLSKGSVSASQLFGSRGKEIADSLGLIELLPGNYAENIDTPMTKIQGIFIPVNTASEIGAITSQLSFYNIKAQILGGNEWYEPPQLQAARQHVNGAMFISDSYFTTEDPVFKLFDDGFFLRFKKHPTKYTLYGYDTMTLLLDLIQKGAVTREVIAEQLARVTGFPGLHSSINLASRRVNSHLHVLRYEDGNVVPIGEVSVEQ
jgi:ABC-type branched-subunit amino acid transport system substrate-binding protein